jgi:hypothetical protein
VPPPLLPAFLNKQKGRDTSGTSQPRPAPAEHMLSSAVCCPQRLQDILAMRKSLGNLSGRLLVNDAPAPASFIRKTSYVPQV